MITKEAIEAGARGVYYAAEVIKEHDDIDGLDWEVDWGDVKDSYPATHEYCVEVATACLTAAFAAMPGPSVKALEWVPIIADGRDIEAVTEFGKYTISVDSSFAGGTHYLWTPDQCEYDDDHHSEHRGMTSARAAAQSDYEARIMAAIEPQAQVRCRDCDGYNCDDGCAYPDTARVETSTDLASENERMRAALEFVTLWAWREDPPNANRKLTDEERLSAIKYHPSIRPSRAALERT